MSLRKRNSIAYICLGCLEPFDKDITEVQQRTAEKIGDYLIAKGINFAGIDMIGKYLTEINITSPTCAREIFKQSGKNPIKEYLEIL